MNGLVPEYVLHKGTIAMYPSRNDIWRNDAKHMQTYMIELVNLISAYEKVFFFCERNNLETVSHQFSSNANIEIICAEYDDIWARDIGPSFVRRDDGIICIDWKFNAWGGKKEGAYYPWVKDDSFALCVANHLGLESKRVSLVVEGGGIITDGAGTIFATRSVLLNRNRNPFRRKEDVEKQLLENTGAVRIVWLDQGLTNDETNGHIDNIISFVGPKDVFLATTDNPKDINYHRLKHARKIFDNLCNLHGDRYVVHSIPMPSVQVMTEEEASGLEKTDAMERCAGDILPASYLNFYMLNGAVIIPSFGCETDSVVREIFEDFFADRKVIQLYSREPLLGGGGIHCILHEIPAW